MKRKILKSHIKGLIVDEVDDQMDHCISLDVDLIKQAQLPLGVDVMLVNNSNGEQVECRLSTYCSDNKKVIVSKKLSSFASIGDSIDIMFFYLIKDNNIENTKPIIINTQEDNT